MISQVIILILKKDFIEKDITIKEIITINNIRGISTKVNILKI
jgi:hypothetical protein